MRNLLVKLAVWYLVRVAVNEHYDPCDHFWFQRKLHDANILP